VHTIEGPTSNHAQPMHWALATYRPALEFVDQNRYERDVVIEIHFMPDAPDESAGRSTTTWITERVTLRRPPVVFVHGINSSAEMWNRAFRPWIGFQEAYFFNYEPTNFHPYAANAQFLELYLRERVLADHRRETATATTRVDMVAHSMGGPVVRTMMERASTRPGDDYLRPENFRYGDIRKLLTFGSPYFGTSLANAFINIHTHYSHGGQYDFQVSVFESLFTSGRPERIHNGAICDLAENSAAASFAPVPTTLMQAHAAGAGRLGGLTPPLSFLEFPWMFGGVRETALEPYVFSTVNDGIVEEFSAWGNIESTPYAVSTYEDLYHNDQFSGVLTFPPIDGNLGIASDHIVALQARDALDTDFGWAQLPAIQRQHGGEFEFIGIPWGGGRGDIDHQNWVSQCQTGGPLNLMGLPFPQLVNSQAD
jgi:pimeloyl-ACP methyl ester carboxylesterase